MGEPPAQPARDLDADFRHFCLTDSGFVCRHLLGWNYDEATDGKRINEGTGGVRQDGTHGRMVRFIDDPFHHDKLILAPRGSYKSTIAQGFVIRQILRDPNVRILYGMKTDTKVQEKARAIRNALELPRVTRMWGPQKGAHWEIDKFTVAKRTQTNLQEPTFSTFSLETLPTGGHYNYIFVDDLIDRENCKTPEAIENAKQVAEMLAPLLVNGGYLIFIGTRYADQDMYYELLNKRHVAKFVVGAGVRVVKTLGRGLDLEVEETGLTFPHLTLDRLKLEMSRMTRGGNFFSFSCQYLNVVPAGVGVSFTRRMFRQDRWSLELMGGFTGYVLTDTATSLREEGCYSVVLYLLVDKNENRYLADARIGHWRPLEMIEQVFDVLDTWRPRCNHVGELWEEGALATVFLSMLHSEARRRQIAVNSISIPRTGADQKKARVERLELPMLQGKFAVLDTVPRTFTDLDGEKILFDPEGFRDPTTGNVLPAGELVDEFIRLGAHPKVDAADALAMFAEVDRKTGRLFCAYREPSARKRRETAAELSPTGLTPQGRMPTIGPHSDYDWWSRTRRERPHHQ